MEPETQAVVVEDDTVDDINEPAQANITDEELIQEIPPIMEPETQAVVVEDDTIDDINEPAQANISNEELIQEIPEDDVVSEEPVEVLDAGATWKVVRRAGAGVDDVDVEGAGALGVDVINAPGANAMSACELTCRLAFALAVPTILKNGRRERPEYTGNELKGKKLGVIGLGMVGREVAMLMQMFGMKVFSYDPYVPVDAYGEDCGVRLELSEIWPIADYITLHMPLIEDTRNFLDADVFNQCKKGVRIINVSGGSLINKCDLIDALQSGQVNAVALQGHDPVTMDIINHPDVSVSQPIGPSRTSAAQVEIEEEIAATYESD